MKGPLSRMRALISVWLCLSLLEIHGGESADTGMFQDVTEEVLEDVESTKQKNYGIAVADVNDDDQLDWIIAGFGKGGGKAPNLVLSFDKSANKLINIAKADTPYVNLMDEQGAAIGVCACDIDGDGREEIYFLNTNGAYDGVATYGDKLFKWRNGQYEDLFSDPVNSEVGGQMYAGRSVACVDRKGTGKYGFVLATYASEEDGAFGLIEMDEDHDDNDVESGAIVLKNSAIEAGIDKPTGGRGVAIGPILNDEGRSDIFFDNENGANFLFSNGGDGVYEDVASRSGVTLYDFTEDGRGVALADFNGDGLIDITYGNWNGPHRVFLQVKKEDGKRTFENIAVEPFSKPSYIRTVIAADFDNDGNTEIFLNNIYYKGEQPNHLFTVSSNKGKDVTVTEIKIGDAEEPDGYGTGGAAADVDGDGVLELILSHGESGEQPLSVYHVRAPGSRYLRVAPLTRYSAPARGARVTLTMADGTEQTRVIDGGSGYLCQMEPVAHFGLGEEGVPVGLSVTWPDTEVNTQDLDTDDINKVLVIKHPSQR